MKHHFSALTLSILFSLSAEAMGPSANSCSILFNDSSPTRVIRLLKAHREHKTQTESKKLLFNDVQGRDVYNPTKPFSIPFKGRMIKVLAARVESRDSEQSEVVFFSEREGAWSPVTDAPVFKMQDPFFTFIDNEIVLGGVEIFVRPGQGYGYRTIFFRAQSLDALQPSQPFAKGPNGMKDIRLVQLPTNKIGLFTRPQGPITGTNLNAGPGKIGFKVIGSLDELTEETIVSAPLLQNQFAGLEWGGVNEAQLLANGKLAVLAHIARFDAQKNRHYYAAVFTIDPRTEVFSPFEIVLERANLADGLDGHSKREDLKDVVFSGGMALGEKTMTLYVGAGDAEAHEKVVSKPDLFK